MPDQIDKSNFGKSILCIINKTNKFSFSFISLNTKYSSSEWKRRLNRELSSIIIMKHLSKQGNSWSDQRLGLKKLLCLWKHMDINPMYICSDLFRLNVIRIILMIFLLYIFLWFLWGKCVSFVCLLHARGFHLRKIDWWAISYLNYDFIQNEKYILEKSASL